MRSILITLAVCFLQTFAFSQSSKPHLFDLLKKLLYDSTGYENVGDWAVGQPRTYPVSWKADRIEMSDDTSINFYRDGRASLLIGDDGKLTDNWTIRLQGARSGYSSFYLLSQPSADFHPNTTISELLSNNGYEAKLLKSCEDPAAGYYYYQLKIPGKDPEFIKVGWKTAAGKTALSLEGFDSWSQYKVKLACPQS